ncbi:carboxylesterase [Streptomyces canus]|uniref:Carboxylesterase n=2 Tax=Streptomyces canus TaxID=58343 RepID=A0A101RK16_9ACTN|nr:carboxylesterase [Streptomyces canus]
MVGREAPAIHGGAEPGFGRIVDVFRDNFRDRGDVGAGCTVYVDGQKVVDIWAGVADTRTGRAWDEHTAAVMFSCTKGILALCVYRLVEEGRLDLDVPLTTYWPEFAAAGKRTITMRHVLAHRAGLPALEADLARDEICAWDPAIRALEGQEPIWTPGTAHSYHPVTIGWITGEVIRRISGLTPGRFFRQTLVEPLGLDIWIGLPASARPTVAWMEPPLPDEDTPVTQAVAEVQATPVVRQAMSMGGAMPFPTENGIVTLNDPALQAAELPGVNGIGTPRSLARLYAGCVTEIAGPRTLSARSVTDALVPQSWGQMALGDPDLGQRWGTGFMLSSPPSRPMLSPHSFGHDGAGGQLGFADEGYGVGFAYLSNQMGPVLDQRANELTRALGDCLGARTPAGPGR